MSDFERKLQLRTLFEQLMFIAIAKGALVEHISEYADREVDGTPSCKSRFLFQKRPIIIDFPST